MFKVKLPSFHFSFKQCFTFLFYSVCLLLCIHYVAPVFSWSHDNAFASLFRIIPDSLEHVICSQNFLEEGKYGLNICGEFMPSRYLPWYPLLFIAPFQVITGELSGAVYGVFFSAGLLVVVLYSIINRVTHSRFAAVVCILAVFFQATFISLIGLAMTEFPYWMFSLLLLALYLHMKQQDVKKLSFLILCGVAGTLAGCMRSTGYLLLIPFIFDIFLSKISWKKKFGRAFLVCIFPLGSVILTACFNHVYFGSFFRNGYHFWCPVPYCFPGMTFNFSYVSNNFYSMIHENWFYLFLFQIAVCILGYCFDRKKCEDKQAHVISRALLVMGGWHAAVVWMLYLGYFFYSGRFFFSAFISMLPATAWYIVNGIRRIFEQISDSSGVFVKICKGFAFFFTLFVICLSYSRGPVIYTYQIERMNYLMEQLNRTLPNDAVFLSPFTPGWCDYFLARGTNRKLIPLERGVEYTGKVLVPNSFNPDDVSPKPQSPFDHACIGVLSYPGSRYACPVTANDSADVLPKLIRENGCVYTVLSANATIDSLPRNIQTAIASCSTKRIAALGKDRDSVLWKIYIKEKITQE